MVAESGNTAVAGAGVAPGVQRTTSWAGLDLDFQNRVEAVAESEHGRRFRAALAYELAGLRGRTSPMGHPALVRRDPATDLRRFAIAYHRAIEAIVRAWRGDSRLRQVVRLPRPLETIVDGSPRPPTGRIHLARLDLLTQPDGGFRVVETNANCPGALLTCGVASRRWREYLGSLGVTTPAPLDYEDPEWMARWFIEAAEAATGIAPELVILLRERGGNRLELPGLAAQLLRLGIDTVEADPRELVVSSTGEVSLHGRTVLHAYWKLGLREFLGMHTELRGLVRALQGGRIFVQNGFPERVIADHKCCLAVLDDPTFDDLFDADDLRLLRPSLPWSRNARLCSAWELGRIRRCRSDYVLKRPLDTRGRGVVIGRETRSRDAWSNAVDVAVEEGWLVQEFCEATELVAREAGRRLHDVSLGLVNGELAGATMRSSAELRTNVALTGSLHPVFLDL